MSSAALLAERVTRLEEFGRELSEQLGGLARELGALRTALKAGLGSVHGRIDGLCGLVEDIQKKVGKLLKELDLEVRPKLESLTDEAEISASHMLDEIAKASTVQERVARISMMVHKERKARVSAERDAAKWKKLARRVVLVAVLAASGTIATAIAGSLLHHCGVPPVPVHLEVPS